MSTAPAPITPKAQLTGVTLKSGWTLVEQLQPSTGSSGSNFGVGYKATKDKDIAFVKAIDFTSAIRASDPIKALGDLAAEATFEKEVLDYCTQRGMSNVMSYFGHEYISADGSGDPLKNVSCLIMEAGKQDLRRLINATGRSTCAWNLQVISDVAMALAQLHGGGIAHQDIKPSNVIQVVAPGAKKPEVMKVTDLGRVTRRNTTGPFDSNAWPGDLRYSPPERWYGHVPSNWADARDAADAYMLGSLLLYLFTGVSLQALVFPLIPAPFRPGPGGWVGRFDADLLLVLKDVHVKVLNDNLKPSLLPDISDRIMAVATELTNPDPAKRGDIRARRQVGSPVGMDRVQQKLANLALIGAAIERGRASK